MTSYEIDETTFSEMNKRFTYHSPHGDQPARYATMRNEVLKLAKTRNEVLKLVKTVLQLTPKSREQSLALTKLEEAVFWANAAIARNEKKA